MTENEKVMLIEIDQRSKSNIHRIDKLENKVEDIEKRDQAVFEIAASVKLMAQEMGYLRSDVSEVKQEVKDVKDDIAKVKVQEVKQKAKKWDDIKDKLVWVFVGGMATYIVTQLIVNVFAK